MSTKREKFVLLAEKRVIRTIQAIRLIGNLSNRNNYQYSDSDVEKIMTALQAELTNLKMQFKSSQGREVIDFTLN